MKRPNDVLFVGMGSGNALVFDVEKLDGDTWDPTSIESVTIRAEPPSHVAKSFTNTTISDQTAAGLVVTYPLDSEDLDEVGPWRFYLQLTNADGDIVRTLTDQRDVKAEFGL